MSTSPSRSPATNPAAAALRATAPAALSPTLQPFPYDSIPPGASARDRMASGFGLGAALDVGAAEAATRETQARAQGRQEGLTEARKNFDEQLVRERASLAAALAEFTRDRATYFQKVEGEVIQLALAIARKILHREAQLDPLLLAGIVRVALEKIDGATGVVLRINPENAPDWRRYLSTQLEPADRPEIVEDSAQPPDRCTLETSMGTALIGLEVQLKEIEQGLMDLLAARPDVSHASLGNTSVAHTSVAHAGAGS
jgi:flagellar biosynthesis/type III secretory pathway protein FliH